MTNVMQTIREGLVKIACLGNGGVYGNSEGNALAIDLITALNSLAVAPSDLIGEFIDQIRDNDLHENERIALVAGRDERIRRERESCEGCYMNDNKGHRTCDICRRRTPDFWVAPKDKDILHLPEATDGQ